MIQLYCENLPVRWIWLYDIIMSSSSFRVNVHSIVCLNVEELLAQSERHIWSLIDNNGIRTHIHLVCKRTLNYWAQLAKWLSCVECIYLYGAFRFHMIVFKPLEKFFGNSLKFGNCSKTIFCARIGSGVIRIDINIIILTFGEQVNHVDIK